MKQRRILRTTESHKVGVWTSLAAQCQDATSRQLLLRAYGSKLVLCLSRSIRCAGYLTDCTILLKLSAHESCVGTFVINMPYTALQTLGWLARRSKWERAYNVGRAVASQSASVGLQMRDCRVAVARVEPRQGRKRSPKRGLILVFKPVASPYQKIFGAKSSLTEQVGSQQAKRDLSLLRGHVGCGMLDCKVCSMFFGLFCQEAEGGCT